jgi:two-component system response regulator PhoP
MSEENTIVIIEDEKGIIEVLSHLLGKEGFTVRAYSTAEDFISDRDRPLSCIYLIDWNLPGIQGIDILKMIRRSDKYSPLFMMSAYIRPEQIIQGLEAGADDYILKPFNKDELLVRLKNAQIKASHMRARMIDSGLKILPEAHCIIIDGKTLSFTAREFLIFDYLYSRKNSEVNRSEIIALFDKDEKIQNRNIDVHIFSIRKKIAKNKYHLDIVSVWGKGYMLTSH